MNLGIEVLHKKLFSKHVFHENQPSDNHTLFKGVNEFLPCFPYFLIGLGDVGYRRFQLMALVPLRFVNTGAVQTIIYPQV
jgi:hypothetical protein